MHLIISNYQQESYTYIANLNLNTKHNFEHIINVEDGAHLDINLESFWGWDRKLAYFDIKVFNPFASTYASSPLAQCYHHAELDKKRKYDERICEVKRGTFSPLIFLWWNGSYSYCCFQVYCYFNF